MLRQSLLLLLLLIASYGKVTTKLRLNIFNETYFEDLSVIKHHMLASGEPVVFNSWPGPHSEVYDIDDDYSYTDPDVVVKNKDWTLVLEGVMNEDEYVNQLHVDVYWNGNLFHSEDHPLDANVEEQEPYEMKFTWFIPGFAPSGSYNVDLVIRSSGQELGWERASFNL